MSEEGAEGSNRRATHRGSRNIKIVKMKIANNSSTQQEIVNNHTTMKFTIVFHIGYNGSNLISTICV